MIFIFQTDLCSYYFSDVGREHCIVIDVVETASKAQGTILHVYCLATQINLDIIFGKNNI